MINNEKRVLVTKRYLELAKNNSFVGCFVKNLMAEEENSGGIYYNSIEEFGSISYIKEIMSRGGFWRFSVIDSEICWDLVEDKTKPGGMPYCRFVGHLFGGNLEMPLHDFKGKLKTKK